MQNQKISRIYLSALNTVVWLMSLAVLPSLAQDPGGASDKPPGESRVFLAEGLAIANEAAKTIIAAAPPAEAKILTESNYLILASGPGSKQGCTSPWSVASTDIKATPPVIIVCPHMASIYAYMMTSTNLVFAQHLPGHFTRMPTAQELRGAENEINRDFKEVLFYYTSFLTGTFTKHTLRERGPAICDPEKVAYVITRRMPTDTCNSVSSEISKKWLKELGMEPNDVNVIWAGAHHGIYEAVVAHELGHIVADRSESTGDENAEIAADAFAERIFARDLGKFAVAEDALFSFNMLWIYISTLSLKTRYSLPPHEDTRAQAFVISTYCSKRFSTGADDELAVKLDQFRLLILEMLGKDACKNRRK